MLLNRSAVTNPRNVGCAAAPVFGPAKNVLAFCVFRVSVRVPLVVTGLPVIEKIGVLLPSARPTLVTVPAPAAHAPSPLRKEEALQVPLQREMTSEDAAAEKAEGPLP